MNGIGVVALILFVFASFYLYQQRQIETFKKTVIPKMEKDLNATYHDSSFLTTKKLNSLKIFKHKITDIESSGYFENDTRVIEYLKILFVKKDTEENDIENILFNGKIEITTENKPTEDCHKNEYFEAGESLSGSNKNCKVLSDGKYYYFYDNQKLF